MSFVAKPEELLDLKPARALRIVTPPGITLAAVLVKPPRSTRGPIELRLTLAWERGSDGAARMARSVDLVAKELLGPDAPERIRAGELRSPLRDGDAEHPADARRAGHVFAEIAGEVQAIVDLRRPHARRALDPLDPATFELIGEGSILRAMTYLFASSELADGVHAQLTESIAVIRGAPGRELWEPTAVIRS
jgi:hypothetical protein